jgi:hypothetical protein
VLEVAKGSLIESNLQEVYRASKLARNPIKEILAFARQAEEEVQPTQVDTIVREALYLLNC